MRKKKKLRIVETTILVVFLVVVTTTNVFALDWHEQRTIAKEIGRKMNYNGDFRFAYYDDRYLNDNFLYGYYYTTENNFRNSLITFYKSSLDLDRQQFKCLVYHEIGHYVDVKRGSKEAVLSEDYADSFMLKQNPLCEDWKNTRYVGYE